MLHKAKARPGSWQGDGRAQKDGRGRAPTAVYSSTSPGREVVIRWPKRGRLIVAGKLVIAKPLGEFVFAVPYRNRQLVETVSVHPKVLGFARQQGVKSWIVRLDNQGECYRLPLNRVEEVGWRNTSEGQPEFFIPLASFERIPWQEWPYLKSTVTLGDNDSTRPRPKQLQLFDLAGVVA